jgi:hypothetical protein
MFLADPFPANFSGKQRAKSVLPKPYRLKADVDAAFVRLIHHISKRKREPNLHHHGQTDDHGDRLGVTKGAAFCHPETLASPPARLNGFCPDSVTPR